MSEPDHVRSQVTKAYKRIAHLTHVPTAYSVKEWFEGEDSTRYHIGVPDLSTAVSMIYAVEAARACCGVDPKTAKKLLQMAIAELPPEKRG